MKLTGTAEEIKDAVLRVDPDALKAERMAHTLTSRDSIKQRICHYQALALHAFTRQFDRADANLLEIGVYYGFSAAIMTQAAPSARLTTLGVHEWEVSAARINLAQYVRCQVVQKASWDYLETYSGPELDMIFVDGDHKKIPRDMPWWNWVEIGGLMLFHDYSPNGSTRACPPVWRALKKFETHLGRVPDVAIVDNDLIGMAGWYKRLDDPEWPQ